MIFVTPSFLDAVICIGPKIEQKRAIHTSKCVAPHTWLAQLPIFKKFFFFVVIIVDLVMG